MLYSVHRLCFGQPPTANVTSAGRSGWARKTAILGHPSRPGHRGPPYVLAPSPTCGIRQGLKDAWCPFDKPPVEVQHAQEAQQLGTEFTEFKTGNSNNFLSGKMLDFFPVNIPVLFLLANSRYFSYTPFLL